VVRKYCYARLLTARWNFAQEKKVLLPDEYDAQVFPRLVEATLILTVFWNHSSRSTAYPSRLYLNVSLRRSSG